ncbi:MAG: protein translocase subunit SecD [Dongiaceae bacterium]
MAQPPKPRGGGFVYFAKWKTYLNFAVLGLGILFALPNLFTDAQLAALREYVGVRKMSLGLDLRGGSHLLIEVDVQSVVRDRLEATLDESRDVLRTAGITYQGLTIEENAVVATLMNPADAEKARQALQPLVDTDMVLEIDGDGKLRLEITEPGIIARQARAVEQSIEIIRRRIDAEGVKEPSIQREGRDRILVQVPGYDDPKRLRELISTTAKMTFHFVDERYPPSLFEPPDAQVPPGDMKVQSVERNAGQAGGEWYLIERRVMVSGENLVDATGTFQDNLPVVAFEFDAIGARKFCDATTKGVGKLFAIKLDDKIISAPVIESSICGGSGIIRGSFTPESASQLALLLRAGALPASLKILEERSVGAELGADSIAAGTMASYMGLVLIIVALVAVYGLFGLFATVALVFNFVLLIAAMSLLQATLTLPGIAGMVLTLGMAVDANVLIHERIREEIRAGRGPVMAIDAGYRSASGTITDSNLTVIISSIFLLIFGSGTVKGFAITLIIGTIISMYTAVVVARMCTVYWLRRARPSELPI